MTRAICGAALGACALGAPALAMEALPGWDAASRTAGCLAMSAAAKSALPEAAAPSREPGEGDFWSWRLEELVPEFAERLEYWEAAHEWLDEEMRSREPEAARAFLSEYRGRCIVEQATLTSEYVWGMAR